MTVPQVMAGLVMGLVLDGAALAQERGMAFGGVRYGAGPQVVAKALNGLGLTPLPHTDKRFPLDQIFEGRLKGEKVWVATNYNDRGALEMVNVVFVTAERDCLDFYLRFQRELKAKYGDPQDDEMSYEWPYNDHKVGEEESAIRAGKATIVTRWDVPDAGLTAVIGLMVTPSLRVGLRYQSARWKAESERREKIMNAVF
jgi:hypothetical protein